MISYEAIQHAQENVVRTLRREGGELSPSELVLTTRLPYDVVVSVLQHLQQRGIVEVETHKGNNAQIELFRLLR